MLELLHPDPLLSQALARIAQHVDRLTRLEQRMLRYEVRYAASTGAPLEWLGIAWADAAHMTPGHPWDGLLDRLALMEQRIEDAEQQLPE